MLALQVDRNLFHEYGKAISPTTLVVVAFVTGLSIWLVFHLRARFREDSGRTDNELEMLTQFRELRQQGELTEEEYRLIKSRLTAEAGVRLNVTPADGSQSAKAARKDVQQERGSDKTGESGGDGNSCDQSSATDESPNQSSAK